MMCPFKGEYRRCDESNCMMWEKDTCVIKAACIAFIPLVKEVKKTLVTPSTPFIGENELEIDTL